MVGTVVGIGVLRVGVGIGLMAEVDIVGLEAGIELALVVGRPMAKVDTFIGVRFILCL